MILCIFSISNICMITYDHLLYFSIQDTRNNCMNALLHRGQVIKDGAGSWCNNPSDEGVENRRDGAHGLGFPGPKVSVGWTRWEAWQCSGLRRFLLRRARCPVWSSRVLMDLDESWWISEILLLSAASSHSRKKQILVLPISHDLTELWANLCVKVLPVMICNVETRGNSGNHTRQRQIPIFASPYAWLIFSLPPLNAACGNTVNLRIFCPKMSSRNPCKEL